ncbi:MAG: TetR family transcriptional regulator [Mycobacteriaceae bacterium]|nr:TetR family transcriptional regulator [Mycobacteriaceae bacterium]
MVRPATADKRQRRERGSIKPDDIIDGALELAHEVSIDNLSMPLLGKHLGVGVTSIYWYFRKKDDLLNAMADRALRQFTFATPYVEAGNWRESLRNHARMMRKTFLSSPILTDLILIRGALGAKARRLGIEQMETAIDALVEAGLSPEDAFDTYSAVSLHVRGTVVLERLQEKTSEVDDGERGGYQPRTIDAKTTPLIAKLTAKGHRLGAADEKNFEYGLTCILDHASRLIQERQQSAKAPARRVRKAAKR